MNLVRVLYMGSRYNTLSGEYLVCAAPRSGTLSKYQWASHRIIRSMPQPKNLDLDEFPTKKYDSYMGR
jgi:hypothetical protein